MSVSDPDLIVRIAARGEGATADGRHVAFAAPGDWLLADGSVVAGPNHATPPCRHFQSCGGCQLQHVSDAAYATYITDRIVHALHAQGIDAPPIEAPHLSPPRTRRRASLRAERRGKHVVLGFNEGASNRIVDLTECNVLLPELFALVAPLRRLLAALLRDRGRANVTMTRCDQGIDAMLGGFEADGLAAVEALSAFGDAHNLARLSLDEGYGPSVRYAPGDVTVTLSGVPVALPEGAFLQATADGEEALVAAVRTAMADTVNVVDLFAGLGTFALALPGKVHAVEGARDAVLTLASTPRVSTEHRDLFRQPLSADELNRFDGVVLDPPRAGAKEQIVAVAQSKVARIAYVSCNPATFARDARTLIDNGYRLDRITPVGQFRWSTHVELAAAFSRAWQTRP
jgi:23S rRNA (uracil1939-C5)-methyltransferase